MKLKNISAMVLVFALAMFFGCAKKVDLRKPVDQIKSEVQTMSAQDLQGNAGAYAKEIKARKADLAKIADEMKNLPAKEIFSDKSKSVKNRLGQIQAEAAALMERYQVYLGKLREKGADLSKVQID